MTGTEKGAIAGLVLLRQVLDWALTLPQRLPEVPVASSRALHRLARYQATARLYRRPSMVRTFRARLGGAAGIAFSMSAFQLLITVVPASQCRWKMGDGRREIEDGRLEKPE
jgi:hypothetical protein